MATREELLTALRNAHNAGDTAAATQLAAAVARMEPAQALVKDSVAQAIEPPSEAPLDMAKRYGTELLGGAVAGLKNQSAGITGAVEWLGGDLLGKPVGNFLRKHGLSPTDEELANNKAWVAKSGPMADVGQMVADVGTSLAPVSAANKLAGGGALADMAINAGWNALTTPGDDRTTAAGIGAAGAAGGRVLTRALKGPLKPFITPEASILIENGITPPPGGMISGANAGALPRALRSLEDKTTSFPLVGDIIQSSKLRAIREYTRAEINDALAPLNAKLNLTGRDALARAHDIVDRTYEAVKPEIFIDPTVARPTLANAVTAIHNNPMFDAGHAAKLNRVLAIKLEPLIATNTKVTGETAKEMDAYLGEEARKFMRGGPGNSPLGEALFELQGAWRNSMQGTTAHARGQLEAANESFRKLIPLTTAGEKNGGLFTPSDVIASAKSTKTRPSELSKVGREVLQETVPDSGTAGRSALLSAGKLMGLGGVAGMSGVTSPIAAPLIGGSAAVFAGYSKPGLSYLAKGFDPINDALFKLMPPRVQSRLLKMAPKDAELEMRRLSGQLMRAGGNQAQDQE